MSAAPDLFSYTPPARYPDVPGAKARDTSFDAAAAIGGHAARLRRLTLEAMRAAPDGMTADEAAAALGLSVLSIRPRCSELAKTNLIIDSKRRRPNASGRSAIVWTAA